MIDRLAKAMVAVAHSMLAIVHVMLTRCEPYQGKNGQLAEQKHNESSEWQTLLERDAEEPSKRTLD